MGEEIGEVGKEEKPKENVFVRVKERLSKRSKKKKKEIKPIDHNKESPNENGLEEKEVKMECKSDIKITSATAESEENGETSQPQQEKQENFFKRIFKRFSSRSKQDKDMKQDDDIKSLSSVDEDLEISALCKDEPE